MTVARHTLTAFQLRSQEIDDFDDALRHEDRKACRKYAKTSGNCQMRLYLPRGRRSTPPWRAFLKEFDDDLSVMSQSNRAVILVRFEYYGATRYVAFVFGHGRHMLEPDVIDRGFGLRAALNAMCSKDGDAAAAARLVQVGAKTVAQTTMRTSRQASSEAGFDQFGVDEDGDFLRSVTGVPADQERWGSRIHGGESVTVQADVDLKGLAELAKRLVGLGRLRRYQAQFDWIDHVVAVRDSAVVERLQADVARAVVERADWVALAPPERVDWHNLAGFKYSVRSEETYDNLRLRDYLELLGDRAKTLSFETMKGQRIRVVDGDGLDIDSWPVTRALTAQIPHDGKTFLTTSCSTRDLSACRARRGQSRSATC